MGNHSFKKLRDIALGLLRGEISCDWMTDEHEVSLLSDVEHLIIETRDIGMIYEERENIFSYDQKKNPIFSTFRTLTCDEALQVAEIYLRYKAFTEAYVEVEIPDERMNPYTV